MIPHDQDHPIFTYALETERQALLATKNLLLLVFTSFLAAMPIMMKIAELWRLTPWRVGQTNAINHREPIPKTFWLWDT